MHLAASNKLIFSHNVLTERGKELWLSMCVVITELVRYRHSLKETSYLSALIVTTVLKCFLDEKKQYKLFS